MISIYRNPLLGGLCISNTFEGGSLTETGGFYLNGGLLNLAKKVSVLHNDLESKVQEVGGHPAKEKTNQKLQVVNKPFRIRPYEVLQSQ